MPGEEDSDRPPISCHGKCLLTPKQDGRADGVDPAPEGISGEQHACVYGNMADRHPQVLLLVLGDFNHAPPSASLPNITQCVTCQTRDNRILD